MKNIAVILSGCGYKDGSEITEAVSALISLSQYGAKVTCFAPDFNVNAINHVTNVESFDEQRNILSESARISRGEIHPLNTLHAKDFDAVVFPGGFGAAVHLSSWAVKGAQCELLPDTKRVLAEFHAQSKPIAAICISPVLVAKVFGKTKVNVTIGNDKETAQEINKTGAIHVECPVTDFVTDRDHKVITTPAYMYHAKPHEVFTGINKAIKELVEMA